VCSELLKTVCVNNLDAVFFYNGWLQLSAWIHRAVILMSLALQSGEVEMSNSDPGTGSLAASSHSEDIDRPADEEVITPTRRETMMMAPHFENIDRRRTDDEDTMLSYFDDTQPAGDEVIPMPADDEVITPTSTETMMMAPHFENIDRRLTDEDDTMPSYSDDTQPAGDEIIPMSADDEVITPTSTETMMMAPHFENIDRRLTDEDDTTPSCSDDTQPRKTRRVDRHNDEVFYPESADKGQTMSPGPVRVDNGDSGEPFTPPYDSSKTPASMSKPVFDYGHTTSHAKEPTGPESEPATRPETPPPTLVDFSLQPAEPPLMESAEDRSVPPASPPCYRDHVDHGNRTFSGRIKRLLKRLAELLDILMTLVLGIILYVMDVGSDIAASVSHFQEGNPVWGSIAITFVILPAVCWAVVNWTWWYTWDYKKKRRGNSTEERNKRKRTLRMRLSLLLLDPLIRYRPIYYRLSFNYIYVQFIALFYFLRDNVFVRRVSVRSRPVNHRPYSG